MSKFLFVKLSVLLMGIYFGYQIVTPVISDGIINSSEMISLLLLGTLAYLAYSFGSMIGDHSIPKIRSKIVYYKNMLHELAVILKNIRGLQNEVTQIQKEIESFEQTRGYIFITKYLQKWAKENQTLSSKPMSEAMTEIYKDIEKLKSDVDDIKKSHNDKSDRDDGKNEKS